MNHYRRTTLCALAAIGFVGCTTTDEAPEREQVSTAFAKSGGGGGGGGEGGGGGGEGGGGTPVADWRPCRSDAFFVEIPLLLATPPSFGTPSFQAALETSLGNAIQANGASWFCGDGEITCPGGPVTVNVSSVLPQRSTPSYRADGHRRYLRVRFEAPLQGSLLVRPGAECDAVATIREKVKLLNGGGQHRFFVGRECDATVASVQGAPSNEMLTWHLTEMGMPPNWQVSAPPISTQTVDLASVDTGVDVSVGASLGVASSLDLFPGAYYRHPHGSGMAIFGRQLAPNARLHDVRALDWSGSGSSEAVAQAIDDALFGANSGDPSRPLVINLSLGWPTELGRASTIVGENNCSSHENAFGEVVRYTLDVAYRMDQLGDRAVFVTSAPGNQPLPTDPSVFPAAPTSPSTPTCAPAPEGADLYFPAQWSRVLSCRPGDTPHRLAFAAGGVDDRLQPIGVAIPDAETALVAPAQHVYAANEEADPIPVGAMCGAGGSLTYFETLPRAFTGTSVSTALVSAAAARVQAHRLASAQPPMNRDAVATLLYLTGRSLCRDTPTNGVPVRLLDIDRLDYAMGECPNIAACALEVASAAITGTELGACAEHLVACGLEEADANGDLLPNCADRRAGPVSWPPSYHAIRDVCHEIGVDVPWTPASSCGGQCAFEEGAQRAHVGSLGPQPWTPFCPDCPAITGTYPPDKLFLILELTDNVVNGTKISNPFLMIQGIDQFTQAEEKYFIALPDDPQDGEWAPGEHLELDVRLDQLTIDWNLTDKIQASLLVDVTEPSAKHAVTDVSVLRLDF